MKKKKIPIDPWVQLRRSLIRAGLISLIMIILTVILMIYVKFQTDQMNGSSRSVPQSGSSSVPPAHLPAWAQQLQLSTLAQINPTGPDLPPPSPNGPTIVNQPAADDIKDISPPIFYLKSHTSLWIILALLASAAFFACLLYLLFMALRSQRSPVSDYERFRQRLSEAERLLDEKEPEPYARAVSEVVRSYVGWRFQVPSSQLTTWEFLRQVAHQPNQPLAGHQGLLQEFLTACDLIKFARYEPSQAELQNVQGSAERFFAATNPLLENNPVSLPADGALQTI